jgi:hypothetical protein
VWSDKAIGSLFSGVSEVSAVAKRTGFKVSQGKVSDVSDVSEVSKSSTQRSAVSKTLWPMYTRALPQTVALRHPRYAPTHRSACHCIEGAYLGDPPCG